MAKLVDKTQKSLFNRPTLKLRTTRAQKVKDISLEKTKGIIPSEYKAYNSVLTSSLKLNKWGIYYLEIKVTYKTQIPGYDSYRNNEKSFSIVYKYRGCKIIEEEVFDRIERKIKIDYTGIPRITDIKVLSKLGYGIKD